MNKEMVFLWLFIGSRVGAPGWLAPLVDTFLSCDLATLSKCKIIPQLPSLGFRYAYLYPSSENEC